MVSRRIGNDIGVFWEFTFSESETPFQLEGKDLRLQMTVNGKVIDVPEFSVTGNRITWFFYGKDQSEVGNYDARLIVNPGEENQLTHDKRDIFRLVRHSWEENADPNAEVVYVEVESEIGKLIDDRYIPDSIARTAALTKLREDTEAKDDSQDELIGRNTNNIAALQARPVLISDVAYAALVEAGEVDPAKIYMVYEQEQEEEQEES